MFYEEKSLVGLTPELIFAPKAFSFHSFSLTLISFFLLSSQGRSKSMRSCLPTLALLLHCCCACIKCFYRLKKILDCFDRFVNKWVCNQGFWTENVNSNVKRVCELKYEISVVLCTNRNEKKNDCYLLKIHQRKQRYWKIVEISMTVHPVACVLLLM